MYVSIVTHRGYRTEETGDFLASALDLLRNQVQYHVKRIPEKILSVIFTIRGLVSNALS